jgi:inorganic pyrophosphatase
MEHLLYMPTFDSLERLQGVVEIPAGTNRKMEINKETGEIRQDMRDGQPRSIRFLPYPVNYGFVPSTRMDKHRGGDGDPLDVLILAEYLPSGTVLPVIPIGLLLLQDGGEWDNKVLAVPADPNLRIIDVENWHDFQRHYSAIRHILEWYFMYYDGLGVMKVMGWGNEHDAMEEVKKWQIIS